MRHIGTIPRLDQAQLFADYLAANDIDAITEQQGGAWAIWVRDEDAREKSGEFLREFLASSDLSRYERDAAPIRAQRIQAQEQLLRRAEAAVKETDASQDSTLAGIELRRKLTFGQVANQAPLTVTIMLLCTFAWISSNRGQDLRSASMESLSFCSPHRIEQSDWAAHEDGAQDIRRGEFWRLVTPVFLHFGLAHLGLNLFFLFQLGWILKRKSARFGWAWSCSSVRLPATSVSTSATVGHSSADSLEPYRGWSDT